MDKESIVQFLNHYLSLATIIGLVLLVLLGSYFVYKMLAKKEYIGLKVISQHILPLGFFITLGGTLMTLFYSEYLRYIPCDLCWYQRIFLYPQIFLFGYAWYKKDRNILPYTLILSVVGGAIAVYHHMLQIGYDMYKPCSDAPFAVDCAKPSFIEFGFVTFPLMAVVLFGFLITFIVITKKVK